MPRQAFLVTIILPLANQQTISTQANLTVCAATPAMRDSIVDLLGDFNNKAITPDNWRAFLAYPWRSSQSPYGFVMLDGAEIVGFIATIVSPPVSSNSPERLCNISSWILRKDYQGRGRGFQLIQELLKSPHCTFTNMSPSPNTLKGLRALGFVDLEESQTIFTPATYARSIFATLRVEITDEKAALSSRLSPQEKTVFDPHSTCPVQHFHLSTPTGSCYGMFKVSSVGKYSVAQIHYVSDPDVFAASAGHLAVWLMRRHGALKTIIDTRMLKNRRIPLSVRRPIPGAKLYLPGRIAKQDIPNSFSEIVLL